ncbi:Universal stress protein [Sphingobium herbicidovorans NBRC 16415]|jgi:nucleotide-binding universal stress UspA family protein|uniref:Universal stress protein n=1 Tax=Sphingobium herbicidovorans (strain ATCC 700291 / DSM 11019 / CCUG 56400 / KCTC 2939 / LMG 18315 / NBRC 16415 / MH) TaxID=1219045 RepID=A0A086P6H7_SPHHM|nr:universal stress protein [Sphingobium herbicidovorans]KFG88995.1 Universal stress protein [Sphingobium herbicidovorans NBRC 16415]
MYNRILIATDGSEIAQKGVDHGLALAKTLGVEVTIITVTERFPVYTSGAGYDLAWSGAALAEYSEGQTKVADSILAAAKQSAQRLGVTADTLHVPETEVAEAIITAAQERNCDLIVMASHGRRGLGRLMLGSKASEVLTHTDIPVLVVR